MKIKYLGTGAAEGIPAVFCHCNICNHARLKGGRNIRTRSQLLVDDNILIDFGPDSFMHSLMYSISLADIKYCLITHTHDDHLYLDDLMARRRSRANLNIGTPPLYIYGGLGVKNVVKPSEEGFITKDKSVKYIQVYPFESFVIENDYIVTPLPAVHNTLEPFVYVLEKNESRFLYAHDTDFFDSEVWKYLKEKKYVFDVVSLDCTEGVKHIEYPGHMNFERMQRMCEYMKKEHMITQQSRIIANHISHNGLISYDDAVTVANRLGFIVSYDGMEINV